ncbi:MAG TPA: hypothetical protein VMV31_01460 [Terriglobales bacterium]|nr:hypothetical protein [Terriglobales bacterium]
MAPPEPAPASILPPAPAQAAIVLGFLIGTWTLVDGLHIWITGHTVLIVGHSGPWAAWGVAGALLGAAWMLVGNLYLFQNRSASWKAMAVLVVLSSWGAGWGLAALLAQLALLLLPATRRGLN